MANATKNMTVQAGSATAKVTANVSDSLPAVPCPNPAGYTYTGMRYVPVFADPSEWSIDNSYEALEIVLHNGDSYTSKTFVPAGIDISNSQYWVLTGNFNAQLEQVKNISNSAFNLAKESLKKFPDQNSVNVEDLEYGEHIFIEGARNKNDGGYGIFEYSNVSDDSVFSINKGSYFLNAVYIPCFNVGCIGTINDGVTDNTSIVNSWIANVKKAVNCVFPENCVFDPKGLSMLPLESIARYNQINISGSYKWNSETFFRVSDQNNDLANVFSSTQSPNIWLHNTGDSASTSAKLGRTSIYFASGWEDGGLPKRCMRLGGTWDSEEHNYYQLFFGDHQQSVFNVNSNGIATVGSLNPNQTTLCVNNNISKANRILELTNNENIVSDIISINSNGSNLNLRSATAGNFYIRSNTNNIIGIGKGTGITFITGVECMQASIVNETLTPGSFPYTYVNTASNITNIALPTFYTQGSGVTVTLVFEVAGATVSSGGNITIDSPFTSQVGSKITLYHRNSFSSNWLVLK